MTVTERRTKQRKELVLGGAIREVFLEDTDFELLDRR